MARPERVLVTNRQVRSTGRAWNRPMERELYRYPHTSMAQRMA